MCNPRHLCARTFGVLPLALGAVILFHTSVSLQPQFSPAPEPISPLPTASSSERFHDSAIHSARSVALTAVRQFISSTLHHELHGSVHRALGIPLVHPFASLSAHSAFLYPPPPPPTVTPPDASSPSLVALLRPLVLWPRWGWMTLPVKFTLLLTFPTHAIYILCRPCHNHKLLHEVPGVGHHAFSIVYAFSTLQQTPPPPSLLVHL